MVVTDIPNPFGAPVYRYQSVDSTMLEALRLVDQGKAPHGTVVMTDFQEAGQARVPGRRWTSPPGESLLFTLVLNLDSTSGFVTIPFSLLAGLALCRALNPIVPGVQVKWPNDVLLAGKKCAGILTRVSGGRLYIGLGINCLQRDFSGEYNYPPYRFSWFLGERFRRKLSCLFFLRSFTALLRKGGIPANFPILFTERVLNRWCVRGCRVLKRK
ncbi:MAG: biotin--[acetyl-CoA-carboxylase] ligase [Spirochaetales bacterium]|nr:biotin--[acetyl-CoA-carboxylase] ligase [Spirochaetales bacterium]